MLTEKEELVEERFVPTKEKNEELMDQELVELVLEEDSEVDGIQIQNFSTKRGAAPCLIWDRTI